MRTAGTATTLEGAAYGFGWGVGAILFGYGVTLAGMSVGFAIIMGINTAVGSILPFVVKSRAELFTPGGGVVMAGIAGCVVGVAICGGGRLSSRAPGRRRAVAAFRPGCAGVRGLGHFELLRRPGIHLHQSRRAGAIRLGANPVVSTLASWLPVFWGAALALLVWFASLQIRRGTWRKNTGPGAAHDWWMGVLMGAIWFLATIPYGMGAYYLGRLGTSVGWAMNIALSLLVANVFGFLTREWADARAGTIRTLYAGLATLLASVILLAVGTSMIS